MATLGFDPPITPGLMLPVSWYLHHDAADEDDYSDYDCDSIINNLWPDTWYLDHINKKIILDLGL